MAVVDVEQIYIFVKVYSVMIDLNVSICQKNNTFEWGNYKNDP